MTTSLLEVPRADDGGPEPLERFLDWVDAQGLELYPAQEEAILGLFAGDHIIITTPTGSGKSLVGTASAYAARCRGDMAVYTAPIKALVSEKFFQMREVFGPDEVGMVTGDASINPLAPIICCTAEILGYLALQMGDPTADSEPDGPSLAVTMDEFHFYAERDRGWAWQVPLLELPDAQFCLMSATLGDTGWLVDDLESRSSRSVSVVSGGERPVPLEFAYRETPLLESIDDLLKADRAPIYIVHFTQRAAAEQAQALTSLNVLDKDERRQIADLISGFDFSTPFGKDLRRLVGHGVGIHHAGLLPRYRLLVERLAREGLLKLICGTDTLGVGVNVPIRTVLLTQLCKYDGTSSRLLRVREFQQIAGRAGRRGYDTSGTVWAQAPAHVVENIRAEERALTVGGKKRKVVKKKPPERGYAHWDQATFDKLVNGTPEKLKSSMTINHAMVLHLLERPGDGEAAMAALIEATHEPDDKKAELSERAASILASLIESGIVIRSDEPDETGRTLRVSGDLQEDFALNHPLSPFLLDVLATFDPESPGYALDLLSAVEATLEDPMVILLAQQDKARDAKYQELRASGIEYDQRQDELATVTWPRPLADELKAMYTLFAEHHPWVAGEFVRPKAIARTMYEEAANFATFVTSCGVKRSEGVLLRYLTDCYRALERTVPDAMKTEETAELTAWLGAVIRSVDSSLLDEWDRLESIVAGVEVEPLAQGPVDVTTDPRGFRALVRSELFRWVQMVARRDWAGLAALEWVEDSAADAASGEGARVSLDADGWREHFAMYWEEFDSVGIDAAARGPELFEYPVTDRGRDAARQVLADDADTREWGFEAQVDRAQSAAEGRAVVRVVRAFGPFDT